MKRHVNIPIFIPHLGCPNTCVFCNQRTISGVSSFDPAAVRDTIDTVLSTVSMDSEAEIAFFGGSFTGIDRDLMLELLNIAYSYVSLKRVSSVRCSTRPDYINEQVLSDLKRYGVRVIELGLQSIDENVLSASKRGHGRKEAETACKMIVDAGFSLVGQMMIGLPNSTPESELETAEFIIKSGASGARIYPTVVFKGTELCSMAESGKYKPLEVDEAVCRSASVAEKLIGAGVDIIRIGLCASENLSGDDTYYAGPNHPAIGELVENELYYRLIKKKVQLLETEKGRSLTVSVAKGCLSKAIGQRKKNKLHLIEEFSLSEIKFSEDEGLSEFDISVSVQEGEK